MAIPHTTMALRSLLLLWTLTGSWASDPMRRNLWTPDEKQAHKEARRERNRQRKAQFLSTLQSYSPDSASLEPVHERDLERLQPDRSLGWMSGTSGSINSFSSKVLLDPSQEYDMWAQAYRMLGGYIDCDNSKDSDDHHSHDEENGQQAQESGSACSRWMLWAAVSEHNPCC